MYQDQTLYRRIKRDPLGGTIHMDPFRGAIHTLTVLSCHQMFLSPPRPTAVNYVNHPS